MSKRIKAPTYNAFMHAFELNKQYHLLLGWRFEDYHNGGGFWHKGPDCKRTSSVSCTCEGGRLPSLHDNYGLLMEELDRVFKLDWQMRRIPIGIFRFITTSDDIVYENGGGNEYDNESFYIAGLKALIAAKEGASE
jgi:hypothetical protein